MDWRRKIAKWLYPVVFAQLATYTAITRIEQETKDRELAAIQRRGTMREINLHRSRKRPRTKFKKRWPHGKHSG